MQKYRVCAGCFEPAENSSIEDRLKELEIFLLEILNSSKPDLIVLPEVALVPDFDKIQNLAAESVDGSTVSLAAKLAKKYSTNICIPIIENAVNAKYNTAVYIDRNGCVAGKYRKHTPTKQEMDLGILPGEHDQEPVILDGIKIGTSICFDENYPDLIWNWFKHKIDLLVFPSYTYGGKLMASWALMCGVPLISAFPWESAIYDRDGELIASGGTWTSTMKFGFHPNWIVSDIDMQSRIYHLAYNQDKLPEIYKKYGSKVDIRLMVHEAHMRITILDSNLTIKELESEMQLISLNDYVVDVRNYADKLR